jgi:hypothetical protein
MINKKSANDMQMYGYRALQRKEVVKTIELEAA